MTTELPLGDTRQPRYQCVFSEDRRYRYVLTDTWAPEKERAVFIGLNPSTADEYKLDPTLTRIRRWAESWDYGAFTMLNLFAFRSSRPEVMKACPLPEGMNNDSWILRSTAGAALVVYCWGAGGQWRNRDLSVRDLLTRPGVGPFAPRCLGQTKEGFPIHPMARGKHRLPDDLTPIPFTTR